MSVFEHPRFKIFHNAQHPLVHDVGDLGYLNARVPGISRVDEAFDYIFNVLYPDYIGTYATPAALPVAPPVNSYAFVTDDGDGKSAGYIFQVLDGAGTWMKRYDVDWSLDSIFAEMTNKTQYMYVSKYGFDDQDGTGTLLAGDSAGQHIYGGASANGHLTLHANAGDAVGVHTGFVQVDDDFRPMQDSLFSLGTTTERWVNLFSDEANIGTLNLIGGQITDGSGAISFGNENLTTTGWIRVDGGLKDANVVIPITIGDVLNTAFLTSIAPTGSSFVGAINALQTSQADQIDSGFVSWGGAGSYYTIIGGALRIDRPGTGYIRGKLVTWGAPQTSPVFAANTLNYVYIDSTGTIGSTQAVTHAVYEDNVVLFEVLFDGTNYVVVKDNHPYSMDLQASRYLHENVGTIVKGTGALVSKVAAGGGGAAGDREIKIVGADTLEDHGLTTTIPDSAGAGVTWNFYYTNALGKWVRHSQASELPMVYNNAGTPTALSVVGATDFSVVTLYVSKDDLNTATPTFYGVLDNAGYANSGAATTAINNGTTARATNELLGLELAQLGYAIIRNTVAGGIVESVIVQKSTISQRFVGGGNAGSAALVSLLTAGFDGWLSATDTTVQVALETLDNLKFGMTVDNMDFDGNMIAITDVNGSLALAPNGTGSVQIGGAGLSVALDGTQNVGKTGSRFNDIWFVGDLKDGTNTIVHAELFSLRNVGFRDAARTQPVQDGDVLFWDTASGTWLASAPDTEVDHGSVTGLLDDDHTQYALLAGRPGGQTLQGGSGAAEDLTLDSTADVTKGRILLASDCMPSADAAYSGGWSGTDLGDATHQFNDIFSRGQHKGLRLENFTTAGLPAASAQNPGRVVWNTDEETIQIDRGGSWVEVGVSKHVEDTVWDGIDTTKVVTVSANISDARRAIWALHDNSNGFEQIFVKITKTQTQVTITVEEPLDAGSYRLIGIE